MADAPVAATPNDMLSSSLQGSCRRGPRDVDGGQAQVADDQPVTDGTGVFHAVGNTGEPATAVLVQTVARRHVGGFAVQKMFPMVEFYLLHVYVLLQLALFGR